MLPESPAYLWDALVAAKKAGSVAADHELEGYLQDWVLQSAAERQFEIVGEALKNLRTADPATAERIPDVHAIIATRNVLVHAYAKVDQMKLWETLTEDVPRLIRVVAALLAEFEAGPDAE